MLRLDGNRTFLVSFEDRHLNDKRYLAWLRDYDVVKTINRPDYLTPVPFEEVRAYCRSVMNSKTDIFFAVYLKNEDLFIGTLRVSRIDTYSRTADVGILIGDKTKWGMGIGTDAISTVVDYLFQTLGLRKITSGSMAVNLPMVRVFEKIGFKREGVFRLQDRFEGDYCDHIHFGCFKNEFRSPSITRLEKDGGNPGDKKDGSK